MFKKFVPRLITFVFLFIAATSFITSNAWPMAQKDQKLKPIPPKAQMPREKMEQFKLRPDLKVDRIWIAKSVDFPSPLPSDLLNGQTISFACSYSNTGLNVDKAFSIGFYIDGQLIGEKRISSLPSGQTGTIFYPYTLAKLGQHVYKCLIDKNAEIIELKEDNNSAEMNFLVYCDRPDFKVDKFYFNGPNRIKVGEIVRLVCEFLHTSGELSGPVNVELITDHDWSHPDVISIDHSEPGQSHKVEFSYTTNKSGDHSVECYVRAKYGEPYNLPDITPGQQSILLGWTAIDPSIDKPDFQLEWIQIRHGNTPIDLNTIKIGTAVELTFQVFNWGSDYKGSWTVGHYIDGQLIGTSDYTDLLYTQGKGYGYFYTVTAEGPHTYKCVVDHENKIPEMREDNNTKELTFTVIK